MEINFVTALGKKSIPAHSEDLVKTKKEIVDRIGKTISDCEDRAKKDHENPAAYYSLVIDQLNTFKTLVEDSVLFESTPEDWFYSIALEYDSFQLFLSHIIKGQGDPENIGDCRADALYSLIKIEPKKLTVSEYAEAYSVGEGTVRQWIRRGKIRSAEKAGNEWLIPELTKPPHRGYEKASYHWIPPLDDLPENYEFLNHFNNATIYQDPDVKTMYHALFIDLFSGNVPKIMPSDINQNERERLELILISNPKVSYEASLFD